MTIKPSIKKTVKAGALGLSIALLSGCGIFSNVDAQQFSGAGKGSEINPNDVILATNTPNCLYQDLGDVSVRDVNLLGFSRSSTDIQSDLQKEAAAMGGNAVIDLHLNLEFYQGKVVLMQTPKRCGVQKV